MSYYQLLLGSNETKRNGKTYTDNDRIRPLPPPLTEMVIAMFLHPRIQADLDVARDAQFERRLWVHGCDPALYVV